MPSTTGNTQQWQPRMPSRMPSAQRRWNSDSTSSSRPPQYGQRSISSVASCILFAGLFEHDGVGLREDLIMPNVQDQRVLVVGATGQLGGAIARKLLAGGVPVRALARRRDKLEALAATGAEISAVDLLDLAKLTDACRGVAQIIATANNNMGKGATSPMRIDLAGYQNLCAAVRNTGVRRLLYVSFRGASAHL